MSNNVKKMSVKEFRELGYLQELNRQFLHPLGLALEVVIDADGNEAFGEVWDGREDPEGWCYGDPWSKEDVQRATTIANEYTVKAPLRFARLGYIIQPCTED